MRPRQLIPCLLLLLGSSLLAQTKTTRVRGTVEDASTRKPIGGATVNASGDTAQQSEVTDDNGFFRLVIEGVAPGDLVRIRVVKPGYTVYDRQIVSSEEIPITVDLRKPASAATPVAPSKPTISTDPLTAHAIQMMTSETKPLVRLAELGTIVKSARQDPAALAAVIAAIADADYRVREQAATDLGWIGKPTPAVINALRVALDDVEPEVRATAIAALGQFTTSKDAVNVLFEAMGAAPNVDENAAMTLHNQGNNDPRVLAAFLYLATVKNDKNVLAALTQMRQNKSVLDALFTTLGRPPNVNVGAMRVLQSMGVDDPREMDALIYEASVKKNADAITALGHYPQNKQAVEALLVALGTTDDNNEAALNILDDLGIDDPRLSEVLLARANTYTAPATKLLLKKAPLSPALIAQAVRFVTASLDGPSYRQQIYISILLQGGGAPGRQALHHLLATSDAQHQGLLALAWLEVEHSAAQEILPDLHLPETQAYLYKLAGTSAIGSVALPEYDTSGQTCNEGPSLRAIMGLSVLDLPPHKGPVKTLIAQVNESNVACGAYAAAAIAWFGPTILKAATGDLIKSALCRDDYPTQVDLATNAAADTLASIGTQNTISQIKAYEDLNRSYYQQNLTACTRFGAMDDLIARIQSRLNGR